MRRTDGRTARRTVRRLARPLTGTALAVVAAGLAAAPAYATDTGTGTGTSTSTNPGTLEVYPSTVVPGGEVTVNTAACGADGTATGDAGAVGAGTFTLAPSTHREDAIGQFKVPPSAQPGTYEIVVKCSEGGTQVTGDLMVTLTSTKEQVHPRGRVKTGVGGALGADPVQTAGGDGI